MEGRTWIVKFIGSDWLNNVLKSKLQDERDVRGCVTHSESLDTSRCLSCDRFVMSGSMCTCSVPSTLLGKDPVSVVPKDTKRCTDSCVTAEKKNLDVDSLKLKKERTLEELKQSRIYTDGLGLVKDFEARLMIKDGAKPIMLKARPLPYAVRDKVKEELDSMVKAEILGSVESSDWGTPIVVVTNKEKIRICRD